MFLYSIYVGSKYWPILRLLSVGSTIGLYLDSSVNTLDTPYVFILHVFLYSTYVYGLNRGLYLGPKHMYGSGMC